MATVIYFDDQWKGSKVLHNYYYITHTHTHTHNFIHHDMASEQQILVLSLNIHTTENRHFYTTSQFTSSTISVYLENSSEYPHKLHIVRN